LVKKVTYKFLNKVKEERKKKKKKKEGCSHIFSKKETEDETL
jgi:hypothetical protein